MTVTVIDNVGTRYDFDGINGWVTGGDGYLDLLNKEGDYVARFAPGWRGIYQSGSEVT